MDWRDSVLLAPQVPQDWRDSVLSGPRYPGDWRDSVLLPPQEPYGLVGLISFGYQVTLGLEEMEGHAYQDMYYFVYIYIPGGL